MNRSPRTTDAPGPERERAPHPATLADEELLSRCELRFTRRSGPGGQNRNKVETAVTLTHRPSGLRAEASERRSQAENRREALFRLRLVLAVEVRAHVIDAPPSALWLSRVGKGGRIAINPAHADFPALLAEALDHLNASGWDSAEAARVLGTTSSQLVRLLKHEPRAFARLNDERRGRGLPPLA